MLLYIINNKKNKTTQFVYYNEKGLYGYSIGQNGYQKVDSNINEKLWKLLKGKFLRYVSTYYNYDVYLDENNYKHFYKEGIENYNLFLEVNGQECILNSANNYLETGSIIKKFLIAGLMIIVVIPSFCSCQDNVKESLPDSTVEIIDVSEDYLENEVIDVDTAIMLIDGNENTKVLKNDLMLRTIFPYYQGTNMEYIIQERLTGINISYYNKTDYDKPGYYDVSRPNVINVLKEQKKNNGVKRHEYNHLLQNVYIDERIIIEAMADIMTKEFYDEKYDYEGYYFIVRDTYMLAAIIGPEPFYQMVYGGNPEPLYQSVSPYLSEDELAGFKEVLKTIPTEKDINHDYESFIKTIYKNKYHQDMMENDFMNCLYADLTFFERINMFNPYKATETQRIEIAEEFARNLHDYEEDNGHFYISINLYSQFKDQYDRLLNNSTQIRKRQ